MPMARTITKSGTMMTGSETRKVEKIARKITSRPGWENVTAVRNGAIHEIKSAFILQPGPASLTEGLRQLHEIIAGVRLG